MKLYRELEYDLVVPCWALCAIVNNDYEGLTDQEITKVKTFIAEYGYCCGAVSEESYFSWHNDIDGYLGADVQDYKFIVREQIPYTTQQKKYILATNILKRYKAIAHKAYNAGGYNDPKYKYACKIKAMAARVLFYTDNFMPMPIFNASDKVKVN
jgi:hypothetical protein